MRLGLVTPLASLLLCGSACQAVTSTPTPPPAASSPAAAPATPHATPAADPPAAPASDSRYPVHQGIVATYFYGGETASASNNWQTNAETAWCGNWKVCYGGVDSPTQRRGDLPAGFTPKENPFYVALPCSDFNSQGLRPDFVRLAARIPWLKHDAQGQPVLPESTSVLKNRWVKLSAGGRTVYGQWEDTGPFERVTDNDCTYVFGPANARPRNHFNLRAGIDVSPAIQRRLGLDGSGVVAWQFVDQPPAGPWSAIVTTSPPYWP